MPTAASNGRVSSKMRPFESAMVSVDTRLPQGKKAILPEGQSVPLALLPRGALVGRRGLDAGCAKGIDVESAAPREARIDGERIGRAALPDIGEYPLDAMFVKAGFAAK